jgi:hypothetical protein
MNTIKIKPYMSRINGSRPNTAQVNKVKLRNQYEFEIKASKIVPSPRLIRVQEVGTSPILFDQEIPDKTSRRKIIIVKKNNYESPSLLVNPDIVKQYEKSFESAKTKKKAPLSFMALPIPPSRNTTRVEPKNSSTQKIKVPSNRHIRLLKRHLSDNHYLSKKPPRMFDYNEILNIKSGIINLK